MKYLLEKEVKPYWVNTGSNELIKNICSLNGKKNRELLEKILRGEDITAIVSENAVYANVNESINDITQFLLFSGYLTVKEEVKIIENGVEENDGTDKMYMLNVPNLELKSVFKNIVNLWFANNVSSDIVREIKLALVNNEIEEFANKINILLLESSSYFDSSEGFYHGLMFMLLSSFGENYMVTSNKESGTGRYDIEFVKKDNSYGAIFEFKFSNNEEDLEKDAIEGYNQIIDRKYDTNLKRQGVKRISKFGIAFKNKKASIYYDNMKKI